MRGVPVGGSPFGPVKVLPGESWHPNSPGKENNVVSTYQSNTDPVKRPRCYVGDVCSIEVLLRDKFSNDLNDEP